MSKINFALASFALCLAFGTVQAHAEDSMMSHSMMKAQCTDDAMMSTHTKIDAMADGDHKMMANKEMDMAKDAMAHHKMKTCATHINKAMKDMM